MNGMVYIRGDRLDYDGWAYHGCPGWSYEDVLPLFRRSEDFDRGESEAHGVGGPLHVTTRYEPHPLLAAMQEACLEAGIPYNADHNDGGELDGVGPAQLTIRDGRRHTAAVAFVHPILDHPNLTVLTDARALGLRFDGARCTGVEIARDGTTEVLEATAEVVLERGVAGVPAAAHAGRDRAGRGARAPRHRVARGPAGRRRQPARPLHRAGAALLAGRGAGRPARAAAPPRPPLLAQPPRPAGAGHAAGHVPPAVRRGLVRDARARLDVHAGSRAHPEPRAGCD